MRYIKKECGNVYLPIDELLKVSHPYFGEDDRNIAHV